MLASGAPLWVAIPFGLAFAAALGGYIIWASCASKDERSGRTDDYE